jgi:hypothetical protein
MNKSQRAVFAVTLLQHASNRLLYSHLDHISASNVDMGLVHYKLLIVYSWLSAHFSPLDCGSFRKHIKIILNA